MGLAKELRSKRSVETREVSVEAWGDENEPYVFWCRPLSCYDLNVLQKKHPKFLTETSIAAMVDLIVMKALDEDGNKLFNAKDDRIDLLGETTDVISDIAAQMFADIEPEESLLKN
jgi:hypothetical protein